MTEATEDVGTNALEPTPAPEIVETPEAQPDTVSEIIETPAETPLESPKDHGNKGKTPWYMQRLSEEANRRQQVETQLEQERREKNEARALLERLQGDGKDGAPRTRVEEPDIDALIDARADLKLFNADCNSVAERGSREIDGFNEKLGLLRSVGVISDDFLKDIFAVDKADAHKILDRLAQEPERANMMVKMDSRKRIAELTRMQMTEATKPAPTVAAKPAISRVPPPKPVLDAVADDSGSADLNNDKLDDQTWSKLWDKKYKKRA
jgi:hypothetical protein